MNFGQSFAGQRRKEGSRSLDCALSTLMQCKRYYYLLPVLIGCWALVVCLCTCVVEAQLSFAGLKIQDSMLVTQTRFINYACATSGIRTKKVPHQQGIVYKSDF